MTRTGQGTAESPAMSMAIPAAPLPQMQEAMTIPVQRKRVEVKRTTAEVREVAVTPDNDFLFGAFYPEQPNNQTAAIGELKQFWVNGADLQPVTEADVTAYANPPASSAPTGT